MKIYEIGTGYTPIPAQMGAATEIVVEELTKAFQKQGVPVEIVDIKANDRQLNALPIREVWVPGCFSGTDVKLGMMHKLKRVVYSVCLAGELRKILKNTEEKVILHFHNQYNMYFFLKLVSPEIRAKARIAYTVHSYIWPEEWETIKDTVKKRYFQEIYCVQNADCVLVLNDRTAEHFVRHLGVRSERIHKVNNGVNVDVYHRLPEADVEAFKYSKELAGKQIIFQVGSVCDRKNQLGAVKLLKDYLLEHPDTVYVYAGGVIDPEYQSEIQRFAAEHSLEEQVRYAGELCPGAELNQYYNAAAVTMFPSKLESFGLVIIESLSAGTPVLVAGKPLFPVEHGCYVYGADEEFIRLMDHLLKKRTWDPDARNEMINYYGWEKIARDHRTIFEG